VIERAPSVHEGEMVAATLEPNDAARPRASVGVVSTSDGPTEGAPEAQACADPARLRAMIDAHYDFIWRSVRRLGVRSDMVEDAVQQVFLVAARKVAEIADGSEKSFLFGTAIRVASDTRKRAHVRREVATDTLDDAADETPSAEDLLDEHRARALLDRVLSEMDLDLRTVIVLYELEEMSTPEIAALLGIPLGTAASRLRRAREDLEGRMRRHAAGSPGRGGAT
jgi:RNA polymerase sigma-70 factor, ECF subfamily